MSAAFAKSTGYGKQGGPRSNAGVDGIHFTPGNPFGVRGGVAVYS